MDPDQAVQKRYKGDLCGDCNVPITVSSKSGLCKSCCRSGKRAYQWKGDSPGYFATHFRVNKKWGKAKICERCETTDKRLEWSNNGNLDSNDRSDWEQLCVSCHRKKDMTDEIREGNRLKALGNKNRHNYAQQYT